MTIAIRRASRSDRVAVLTFHRALYRVHRDAVLPEGMLPLVDFRNFDAVLREDVDAMLTDGETVLLLASIEGRDVGYVSGHVEVDDRRVIRRRGVVGDWYVDAEVRGQGVGRALMQALEKAFREAGCVAVESATWAFNPGARAAHLELGFREVQVVYRKLLD